MAWDTALGSGLEDVWQRLLQGVHGFRELASASPVRNALAAPLAAGVPPGTLHTQHVAVTVATARRALEHAGLTEMTDVQLVLGTSLGPHADSTTTGSLYTWAEDAARLLGSARPPVAVSTACSASSDALSTAAVLIGAGLAERCLAGGVDLLSPASASATRGWVSCHRQCCAPSTPNGTALCPVRARPTWSWNGWTPPARAEPRSTP